MIEIITAIVTHT